MSTPTYSATVVGGGAGGKLSMTALTLSDRFNLVAACDLRPEVCEVMKQKFPGLKTFTDHRAMFRECPTDVVCVSTFPSSHEEVTLDALKLPLKGIVVEKPLGHTAESGRRILESIKARKLPMAVPHGLLVRRHAAEIIQRVKAGEIGELKLVEIQCRGWDIINAGIHWLNFFVKLTEGDAPVEVLAAIDKSTRTWRDGMQVETVAVTSAQTKSGIRVVMHTGDTIKVNADGRQFCFRIIGTLGMIEFWAWAPGYRIVNAANPQGKTIEPDEGQKPAHQLHLENLAKMMDAGITDYAVPESSLIALELVEGAYRSAREGRALKLPLSENGTAIAIDWDPGMSYSGSGGGRDGRQFG
jgi:predicted dehydrogenase